MLKIYILDLTTAEGVQLYEQYQASLKVHIINMNTNGTYIGAFEEASDRRAGINVTVHIPSSVNPYVMRQKINRIYDILNPRTA